MKKLIMTLALMPLMALADTEKIGDVTWSYTVVGGMATVEGADSSSGALIIPSTLGGCPVTSIGRRALEYCYGVTSVTIPSSVTSIGIDSFFCPVELTEFVVEGGNANYCSLDGILYNKGKTALILCPHGKKGALTIPSSVTSIEERAFWGCDGLTSVTMPSSVTSIGVEAFGRCNGLTSVTIPPSVTSIEERAFWGCDGLTSVTIPRSVTSIGEGAFEECDSIQVVFVTDAPQECVKSYFGDQMWYQKIGTPIQYEWDIDYSDEFGCGEVLGVRPGFGDVVIPSRWEGIPVRIIGAGAFCECRGLTSVVIPPGVTSIESFAFEDCGGLTSVTIPPSVTSIGSDAFCRCTGLASVTIPSSVKYMGYGAFACCSSLMRVYFLGNAPRAASLYEDSDYYDGVNYTPVTLVSYAREGSTGWSSGASTVLPDSWQGRSIAHGEVPVVIDGVEWNFTTKNGKVSLGAGMMTAVGGPVNGIVTIPAEINGMKVVELKDGAFAGLDGITSVSIPASVRTIGSKAFYGCDGLEMVTFLGDAPYVYDDAFSGTKSTLAFSVPQGSIGWSDTSLTGLPGAWKGHAIQYTGGGRNPEQPSANLGMVTVSNIVVHYILNSIRPEFAIQPADDMNFVNIITEVEGSAVAIPETWAASYPGFVEKFGADFTQALMKPTGKIGTGGTPMLVWQDYVAGTDPTNEKDVFTASIAIVDGKVTISYTPELDDTRKAMRKYTIWGKSSLLDADWTEVPEGNESKFNFFKVSVEMQ